MRYLATVFTAAAVALIAAPVAAQEGADTAAADTLYRTAKVPVWVMVEDVEGEAGAHRVYLEVTWSDYRSVLPFSREVGPGDLTVFPAEDGGRGRRGPDGRLPVHEYPDGPRQPRCLSHRPGGHGLFRPAGGVAAADRGGVHGFPGADGLQGSGSEGRGGRPGDPVFRLLLFRPAGRRLIRAAPRAGTPPLQRRLHIRSSGLHS